MAKKTTLKKELVGLGQDLTKAFKTMLTSKEFEKLQKNVGKSIRTLSASLGDSMKAAQKSPQTKKLKRRLGAVMKLGKQKGMEQAKIAQGKAAEGIQKMRVALNDWMEKRNNDKRSGPMD